MTRSESASPATPRRSSETESELSSPSTGSSEEEFRDRVRALITIDGLVLTEDEINDRFPDGATILGLHPKEFASRLDEFRAARRRALPAKVQPITDRERIAAIALAFTKGAITSAELEARMRELLGRFDRRDELPPPPLVTEHVGGYRTAAAPADSKPRALVTPLARWRPISPWWHRVLVFLDIVNDD